MVKINQKQNIFRIAPKTDNIGAYSLSNASNSADQIKEEEKLKEKYNEELLKQALQLKANVKEYAKKNNLTFDNDNKLTAEYFISLAHRMNVQGMYEASLAVYKNKLKGYPDVDSQWAEFSYEEIIEMENNGCNIPEEVLLWAHAQQQADITSYVIVSDNNSSEDELSKQDNDINSLEKKVKQYVTQAENAIEASEQAFEKYTQEAEKAAQIKKEKENTYKDQMEEISDLTKEWKALNEKNKANSLNDNEKQRFNELGKQINGSNGTKMKEVKDTHNDLDNFLDSIDKLNTQTTENTQISQDTVNATIELSKLTRNFTNFVLPHDTKERFIDNGLLANTLQNTRGDEITAVAMDTTRKLDETTASIDKTLKDTTNTELADFSSDYVSLADKTEKETKDSMGEDYDKSQNSEEDENKEQKVINKDKYSVAKIFSFVNAIAATGITLKSLSEMNTQKQTTESTQKSLKTAMKTSEKDIKSLNKESKTLQQKQEQNTQEEENFLTKLDSINEKQSEPAEKPEDAKSQNEEKANLTTELETLNSGKKELNNGLQKAVAKSLVSDKKSSKLSELLRANTKDLVKINNNTQKVAADTQYVGTGTIAQSIMTRGIGTILCQTGMVMTESVYPPTVLAGFNLLAAGIAVLQLADLELGTGMTAMATGTMALAASAETKDTEQEAKDSQKTAKTLAKENKANIKESTVQINEDNKNQDNNLQASAETGSTQVENTSQSAEEQNNETQTTEKVEENNETTPENEADNKNNDTTKDNQTQKSDNGYSVEEKYGFTYAVAAAATTIATTTEINSTQATVINKENQFKINLSKIKKLEKQNEAAEKFAQTIQKKVVQESTQTTQQIENANIEMEQGAQNGNAEQITAAQIEIQNLSETLDGSIEEGSNAGLTLNKTLQNTAASITQNENSANDLKKETSQFEKKIDTQRDISEKTLGIGLGTTAVGGAKVIAGVAQMTIGAGLLPNPVTHTLGQAMIIAGNIEALDGEKDVVGGGIATVAGTTGLIVNAAAKSSKSAATEEINDGSSQLKNSKQLIQKVQKENQVQEKEAQAATEEINNISASASTNADVDDSTSNSDKEDRRLSRFNEESIIESKKKRKKVLAVSASTRG